MRSSGTVDRILVVDDNPSIHDDIRKALKDRNRQQSIDAEAAALFGEEPASQCTHVVDIESASQGQEALEQVKAAARDGRDFQMAFVDIRMPPGWDGIRTTAELFAADPNIQVVLCTAYSDYSVQDILERLGRTDRLLILKKPFDIAEVILLVSTLTAKWHLAQEAHRKIVEQDSQLVDMKSVLDLVQSSHQDLEQRAQDLSTQSVVLSKELQRRTSQVFESYETAALALAELAESRDPETGEHLERMQHIAQEIATTLSKSATYVDEIDEAFLENLFAATPLHDIGKVGIPDSILLKPGKLTEQEFEIMKRHTLIGARALEGLVRKAPETTFLTLAADIALHHHERWDGKGYPVGLSGVAIPLAARIAAVADVFDALTSVRVYKDAMAPDEAKRIIEEGTGSQFDPEIVEAFCKCFEKCKRIKEDIDDRIELPETSSEFALG